MRLLHERIRRQAAKKKENGETKLDKREISTA